MRVGAEAKFQHFSLRLMGIEGDTVRMRLISKSGYEGDLFPFTDKEPSIFTTDGMIFSIRWVALDRNGSAGTFQVYQLLRVQEKKAPPPTVNE